MAADQPADRRRSSHNRAENRRHICRRRTPSTTESFSHQTACRPAVYNDNGQGGSGRPRVLTLEIPTFVYTAHIRCVAKLLNSCLLTRRRCSLFTRHTTTTADSRRLVYYTLCLLNANSVTHISTCTRFGDEYTTRDVMRRLKKANPRVNECRIN